MHSIVSGFRSVIAALAAIAVIEVAIFVTHPSTFVERTNYLDWNYGSPEIFHKAMIYQKLDEFSHSAPDIVQVGDSTGLHNVKPEIVEKYLGGLTYLNLSSIANAGYEGQYAIADFMLRRNPHIKAIVLYVTLNQLPKADMVIGDQETGGPDRILNSFASPWAYINPPSMSVRRWVTDAVYSGWGRVRRREQRFFDVGDVFSDMLESIGAHRGWWPEHDERRAGSQYEQYWSRVCDSNGVRPIGDRAEFYHHDPVLGRRSYARIEFTRFADLAARHNAKLVVVLQPYACQKLTGDFLIARKADFEFVRQHRTNFSYEPSSIFEPWPKEAFITADHLRVGYEDQNSERVGRLLAHALGISPDPEPASQRPPIIDYAADSPTSVWMKDAGTPGSWQVDGVSLRRPDNPAVAASNAVRLVEDGRYGFHQMTMALTGVQPGKPYVLAAIARPGDKRGALRLELPDEHPSLQRRDVHCDMGRLEAVRGVGVIDAGLDALPDGWVRCWVIATFAAAPAVLNVAILNEGERPDYVGDGRSGIVVRDVTIGEWRGH